MLRHVLVADDLGADHALPVDDVGHAPRYAPALDEGPVGLRHLVPREVAQEREVQVQALGEGAIGGAGVDADTQDLGIGRRELCLLLAEGQ